MMEKSILIVTNKHAELASHIIYILRFKLGEKKLIRLNSEEDGGGLYLRFGGDKAILCFDQGEKSIVLQPTKELEKMSFSTTKDLYRFPSITMNWNTLNQLTKQ